MVRPTVTATDYAGTDDFLPRMNRTTRDNASAYAHLLYPRGQPGTARAYDATPVRCPAQGVFHRSAWGKLGLLK